MNRLFSVSAAWTAFALVLAGCQPYSGNLSKTGLVYCSQGSPDTLNPQLSTSSTVVDASSFQLYNRLISIHDDGIQLKPELAERWEVNREGTQYTFYLRQGVSFHQTDYFTPSRSLTADDVVFSFQRILNKSHNFHNIGGSEYTFFNSVGLTQLIHSVTALDNYTVRFELQNPDSTFLVNLASDFSVILSAEYATQLWQQGQPERLDSQPIGTGPFKLYRHKANHYLKFKRHPSYWAGPTPLSDLVYDITPNGTMRLAKLLTGECDVMAAPHASDVSLIRSKPQLKMQYKTGFNLGYWAFNTGKAPFDDVRVRKALAMAIDRESIMEAVYYGTASPASGILPPASWGFDGLFGGIEYDPARARALLNEAGYGLGLELEIWVMPIQRAYNPNASKMALLMQESLRQVGVRASLVSFEWSTFLSRINAGEHDTVLLGWTAENADPDNFFRPLLSCQAKEAGTNRAFWCDEYYDRLINLARQSDDKETRKSLYWMAQNHINDQAPLLPIAHGMHMQASRERVHHLAVKSFGGIDFSKVSIE